MVRVKEHRLHGAAHGSGLGGCGSEEGLREEGGEATHRTRRGESKQEGQG